MKEIPILFSTAMSQAILEGKKSQTRRLVKFRNKHWRLSYEANEEGRKDLDAFGVLDKQGNLIELMESVPATLDELNLCPYGQPGDVLWARETHYAWGYWVQEGTTEKGKPAWTFKDFTREDQKGQYHYETNPPKIICEKRSAKKVGWYRRPSIFMPYDAARIWLQKEITKVEKACDISREDAIAEGLACITKDGGRTWKYGIPDLDGLPGIDNIGWAWQDWHTDPVEAFKRLWWSINGEGTWDDWVWVNTFKTLSTTGKPDLNNIQKQ
jgi:hypothetical protein